ncbi:MAG: hypothetical protein PHO10_08470 [Gemmiger sp.]|nr:hypothetical protein [Gemmiger sp.]
MKTPYFLNIPAACLAVCLAGCAPARTAEITWQGTLAATGAAVALSGSGAAAQVLPLYTKERTLLVEDVTFVQADAQADITFTGVAADAITLDFAAPYEAGRLYYPYATPTEKIDYRVETGADATVYHLDTYYDYVFTVTTDAGTDYLMVGCAQPQ